MDASNQLIQDLVKQHYDDPKNKEEPSSPKSNSSNAENDPNQNNKAVGKPSSTEKIRKRKRKDDESTDEEELPRRRAVTMGQHKKRKRVLTKYQRELEIEKRDEKFRAEVFDVLHYEPLSLRSISFDQPL